MRYLEFALVSVLMIAIPALGAVCSASELMSGEVLESEATPQEKRLGERVAAQIEREMTILVNPAYEARVGMIVNRLSPYMERHLNYEVGIIDHVTVNAFSIAGGKMYVTTGMLDFVKTDLELAGVIAHEMVHADRQHVLIQMARNSRMTLLAIMAAVAGRGHGAAVMAANVLHVAVMGAYSVDIEKEADAYAIDALTKAGYNPVGMLTIQERLKEERLKRPEINPGIYRTHPDVEERIRAAERYLESNGIPVNRKHALGNLRPSIGEIDSDGFGLALMIDGATVWRGAANEATRAVFDRVASELWQFLDLETAPFDIRVEGDGISPGSAFFVKSRRIVTQGEAPPGTEALSALREGVMNALSEARRSHPMADYFR